MLAAHRADRRRDRLYGAVPHITIPVAVFMYGKDELVLAVRIEGHLPEIDVGRLDQLARMDKAATSSRPHRCARGSAVSRYESRRACQQQKNEQNPHLRANNRNEHLEYLQMATRGAKWYSVMTGDSLGYPPSSSAWKPFPCRVIQSYARCAC